MTTTTNGKRKAAAINDIKAVVTSEALNALPSADCNQSDVQVDTNESSKGYTDTQNCSPVEDTPTTEPKKRRSRGGDLTAKRKSAITSNSEAVKVLKSGEIETVHKISVRKGQRKAAQRVALELSAEQATYVDLKSQALQLQIQQELQELQELDANFDPNEILASMGVKTPKNSVASIQKPVMEGLESLDLSINEILQNTLPDWI